MALFPNPLIIPAGILIGILVAAPVGPVNVLCIQRAIERGFLGGVAAGLGAMLGDGLIALSASLSIGTISGIVAYHRTAIQILGGVVLVAFGLVLYLTGPPRDAPKPANHAARLRDAVWDIPKTFFLTITNPGAVLGLIAIFGGVSTFVEVRSAIDALTMVAAVMAGSLLWWVSLSYAVSRVRHRLSDAWLRRINRVAGILLVGFGVLLAGEIAVKTFMS